MSSWYSNELAADEGDTPDEGDPLRSIIITPMSPRSAARFWYGEDEALMTVSMATGGSLCAQSWSVSTNADCIVVSDEELDTKDWNRTTEDTASEQPSDIPNRKSDISKCGPVDEYKLSATKNGHSDLVTPTESAQCSPHGNTPDRVDNTGHKYGSRGNNIVARDVQYITRPSVKTPTSAQCEDRSSNNKSGNSDNMQLARSGDTSEPCNLCGKVFGQLSCLKRHMLVHSGEKKKACPVCGNIFRRNRHLKEHMLIHSGVKTHACTGCGKFFRRKGDLKLHMLIYIGVKTRACTVCGKFFTWKSALNRHMLIHSGVKAHACTVCGKYFRQSNHLKYHMLIHSGEKPYECKMCGKRFRQSGTLTAHKLLHSRGKPKACTVCRKRFTTASGLRRHMMLHNTEKPNDSGHRTTRFGKGSSLKTQSMALFCEKSKARKLSCSRCVEHSNVRRNAIAAHSSCSEDHNEQSMRDTTAESAMHDEAVSLTISQQRQRLQYHDEQTSGHSPCCSAGCLGTPCRGCTCVVADKCVETCTTMGLANTSNSVIGAEAERQLVSTEQNTLKPFDRDNTHKYNATKIASTVADFSHVYQYDYLRGDNNEVGGHEMPIYGQDDNRHSRLNDTLTRTGSDSSIIDRKPLVKYDANDSKSEADELKFGLYSPWLEAHDDCGVGDSDLLLRLFGRHHENARSWFLLLQVVFED